MYPGTIFNWYDQSGISENDVVVSENAPLFLAAASFDKGPEDMRIVSGQQFYRLYGNKIDFEKHGQAALQIKNIIDNGGRVLIKRVVDSKIDDQPDPEDPDKELGKQARLANIIFVANVTIDFMAVESSDSDAKTLFEITGNINSQSITGKFKTCPRITEITDKGETNYAYSTVKWTTSTVEDIVSTDIDDIVSIIPNLGIIELPKTTSGSTTVDGLAFESYTYAGMPLGATIYKITGNCSVPVIIVSDIGRGVSDKAVRFMPDYNTSKNIDNFFYAGYVYEGTDMVGKTIASLNPNTVINGINYSFGEQESEQVQYAIYNFGYEYYINILSLITGWTSKKVMSNDIVKLKTYRKQNFDGVLLDADSVDLDAPYGVNLLSGTNGRFKDKPADPLDQAAHQAYIDELLRFFGGEFDSAIYDLDQYKIAAVVDANYPLNVKKAIANLVTFREDCFFFRDYGLNIYNYNDVITAQNSMGEYNKFIGDYLTTYEIFDPYNGKRIRVTMTYDLAGVLVNHFANGAYKPLAGIANNIILRNAIKGTINFTPRITPALNQKEMLEDIKVNYAIFDQDQCVCQTLYTTQDDYTQLSYINNVLGIQEVARAVRSSCPKFRYTFTSGTDFSAYAAEVSSVLANYRNNFAELTFEYQQSAVHASQKIFYATIKFRFNNWAQTEIFDLYALPNENVGQ